MWYTVFMNQKTQFIKDNNSSKYLNHILILVVDFCFCGTWQANSKNYMKVQKVKNCKDSHEQKEKGEEHAS